MSLCFYEDPAPISDYLLSLDVSQIVFLCDQNTYQYCYIPFFAHRFNTSTKTIVVNPGEASKSLQQFEHVQKALLDINADRNTLLVNLGGGVISDLGGFCSATFKRGITCVHIPTTLMAMADASVGGKTGINLMQVKNVIGCFYEPIQVAICSLFLKTLPQTEILSGMAEMFKMLLLFDPNAVNRIQELVSEDSVSNPFVESMIQWCAHRKQEVVQQDPYEKHLRKVLNYGHTLGHAIESWALDHGVPLSHGYAVGLGMQFENQIAQIMGIMEPQTNKAIRAVLQNQFPFPTQLNIDVEAILKYVKNDKKNKSDQVQCVFISKPGRYVMDVAVPQSVIMKVAQTFNQWM